MKVFLVLSILAIGSFAKKARYDGYNVYRLVPQNRSQLDFLQGIMKFNTLNFWIQPSAIKKNVDVMVSPDRIPDFLELISAEGLEEKLLIANVQKLIQEEGKFKAKNRTMDWKDYHTLEDIYGWLEELEKKNKTVVKTVVAGKTYEKRDIKGIEITFKPDQPTVFIEAGMHAREWISPAATSYMVNEILKSGENSTFRKFNYIYIPLFNPDGYEYAWTSDRMWKKTRQPYGTESGIDCYGADPNRNWDFKWDGDSGGDACNDDYPGPQPFSEIETKSLSEFFKKNAQKKKIDLYLSFCSYSQLIMYPWGCTTDPAPLAETWKKIGTAAAEALKGVNGTEFLVGNIYEDIYPVCGDSLDYFYAKYNTTITFEYKLRDTGEYGFLLPPKFIEPSGKELLASVEKILEEYTKLPPKF